MIKEIQYFRTDGKTESPDGVYLMKGEIYKSIYSNKNSFIKNALTESFLHEDIENEQFGFEKYQGGIIVFATSVNSVIDAAEKNKFKAFFKKLYYSVMNYVFKDKTLINLIKKWNIEFGPNAENLIGGFSIGNFFKGRFIDPETNEVYNDTSATIELGGIPSELLLLFAIEVCKAFKQRNVLVKDFNTNKIFFVNQTDIAGNSPAEKLINATKDLNKLEKINTALK